MPKINLDPSLYDRIESIAGVEGYGSVDEFVAHAVEIELKRVEDESDVLVDDPRRNLGYLE